LGRGSPSVSEGKRTTSVLEQDWTEELPGGHDERLQVIVVSSEQLREEVGEVGFGSPATAVLEMNIKERSATSMKQGKIAAFTGSMTRSVTTAMATTRGRNWAPLK